MGFLTGTVAKEEMIKADLSCRDLLDEARNYHLHLSNKSVPDFEYSIRTTPRKHTAGQNKHVCLGGGCKLLQYLSLQSKDLLLTFDLVQVCCSAWEDVVVLEIRSAASSATPSARTAGSSAPR